MEEVKKEIAELKELVSKLLNVSTINECAEKIGYKPILSK